MSPTRADVAVGAGESARLRHVALVADYALRSALRSRSAFVAAALVCAGAVFLVDSIVGPVEVLDGESQGMERPALLAAVAESPHLAGLVTWVAAGDDRFAAFLLHEKPAILSALVIVLLMATPFLVALGTFDQTAGDVGSRWLRFALLRTERSSFFLGRFAASAIGVLGIQALLLLALAAYLDLRLALYPSGDLYGWAFAGWVALAALALPYTALSALVSATGRSALQALGLCLLATALPIFALGFAVAQLESLGWLAWVHPWGWKFALLHPELAERARALVAMLVFAAAFLGLGVVWFRRRDV